MTREPAACAVSVVVPVYNPGPLLREQLVALAAQRLSEPWEVVLADNGCTDGSLAVVEEFRDLLDVRIVDASDHPSASYARNKGAAEARGQWLVFCDSDDVAAHDWLANLWAARHSGDIVCGPFDVTLLNDPDLLKARGGPDYGRALPDGPCGYLPYASSANVLVNGATFEKLGGWDESLPHCEDVDFSWRAQLAGASLVFAPGATMHYRYRSTVTELFHQMRRYKASEALLFVRYRAVGAKRQSALEVLERAWWIGSRSPYLLLGRERRALWFSIAGTVAGRIEGSLRHRVVYL
ncbi:glycosyltransferase [Nocardioides sp. YIM 152315]|uniref:glycosyltransferase family 2 protein n=1 Tax=Nocardioides sp. YIM 152315 TaxID=3031760 RepID=UPI0023DC3802|nr:glycosyltransferase [Nocardioides sp. YIM 152315]MDF1603454.1 glycosyltransferase [Nocardioides sp. YIM 152315]